MISALRRSTLFATSSVRINADLSNQARKRTYHEISFKENGDPKDVLEYHRRNDYEVKKDHSFSEDCVKVEFLHAPWNPADKNVVQGKYPSPSTYPLQQPCSVLGPHWKVAGSEGWGRVVEIPENSSFEPGDFVTLGVSGMGTFRSQAWLPSSVLIPIDRGQDLFNIAGPAASSIFQLGGTAFRMLNDFVVLKPQKSVIIQNAGNSGVGYMVSQLAAAKDVPVISLVRRGHKTPEQFAMMVDYLTQQHTNTTRVVAEEDLLDSIDAVRSLQAEFNGQPSLALNAVGGPSASFLLKMLSKGGTMVTYGGMSLKPVTVATPQLIFKDVKVLGYWHSRWMMEQPFASKKHMVDELVSLMLEKDRAFPPVCVFTMDQMKGALEFESLQSREAIRKKIVFDCQDQDS